MLFVNHKMKDLSHKMFCGSRISHKTHRQQQDERRATGVEVGLVLAWECDCGGRVGLEVFPLGA